MIASVGIISSSILASLAAYCRGNIAHASASAFLSPSPIKAATGAARSRRTVATAAAMLSSSSATAAASTAADASSSSSSIDDKSHLYMPSERDKHYDGNIARYLLDLHDERATFDFCGGMLFQLVLSDRLRSHLEDVASSHPTDASRQQQPVIRPSSQSLMNRVPGYDRSSQADNVMIFHGRELRGITNASGGMGYVLQLSFADPSGEITAASSAEGGIVPSGKGADSAWDGRAVDAQGWSTEEIATYDGWRSDQVRRWRDAKTYKAEGFEDFSEVFGDGAYGLNHRFFLHYDDGGRMWLCAEDGCEGTPSKRGGGLFGKIGGFFGGM
ncbi:hypothetical protein ACHAXA_001151 [Cyclostephanos tholiformis]|uniref:Uncharacterized protein n=1 Tax=Cyclostephanos tholiformis TaxID=382380 RepID=A0ABD3RG51_9STRA